MVGNPFYITYAMLIDALQPFTILKEPVSPPKRYRWISSPHWQPSSIPLEETAFVCLGENIDDMVQRFPGSLLIAIVNNAQELGQLEFATNPFIIIQREESTKGLLQILQNRILTIRDWEESVTHCMTAFHGYQQALSLSESILGAKLGLFNDNANHIAGAAFDEHLLSTETGKHRQHGEIIDNLALTEGRTLSVSWNADDEKVVIIRVETAKQTALYLIAAFDNCPTTGQIDLLKKLSYRLKKNSGNGNKQQATNALHTVFNKLLNGEYVREEDINSYSNEYGLPLSAEYRLVRLLDNRGCTLPNIDELIYRATHISARNSIAVDYKGDLYLLLYSEGMDSSLSNRNIEEQVSPLCEGNNLYVTVSQVFEEISNLQYAYLQTILVEKYREHIDLAYRFTLSEEEHSPVFYTFEEALRFLMNSDTMNSELRDFSFSHTIIDKILTEDTKSGGDDVRILATYIHYERKATLVAEKLHMHRNTVLYRIDKIEKRFGLDFDESWSRNRVLFDLSILYSKLACDDNLRRRLIGKLERPD